MESQSQLISPVGTVARCPFRDGPSTLDFLLAELSRAGSPALDLALDLRSAVLARADPEHCVRLGLQLRQALDGTHYLAFYRVRLWLQRVIFVQVRGQRGEPWSTFSLPLNSARVAEIENACCAAWALEEPHRSLEWAQMRFVFRPLEQPATVTA